MSETGSLDGADICVVGFTGQVGSAIVRAVAGARPARLIGVARRPRYDSPPGVEAVYLDAADTRSGESLPSFSHVFYAAGVTSDYRSRPADVIASQLTGLQAFLERAQAGCRFVFVSSARVYGRHATDEPLTEESPATVIPMHLDNLYDSAKRLAESLCLWHAEQRGVDTTVLRAGNLYGTDATGSASSLNELVREAATEGRITLTGNPASVRNYCSVADFANGAVLAATRGRPGRAYNIGSDEHLTTLGLAQSIAACFDGGVEIVEPADPPAASYQRLALDRARTELGYEPAVKLGDVLPELVRSRRSEGPESGR